MSGQVWKSFWRDLQEVTEEVWQLLEQSWGPAVEARSVTHLFPL